MCVGSPLLAAIAEKFKAYYEVVIASAFGMALLFTIILIMHPPPLLIGILFFMIGMLSAYQVLAVYMNSINADVRYSGLVTAITNMIIMSFGSIFHFLISRTMNLFWNGKIVDNLAIYEPLSYIYGTSVIPVTLIIAFFGFLVLRPKRKV